MKIAVFGLGYVGSVTATLLAEQGNNVIGVDINPVKSDLIMRGASPVVEAGLPERLSDAVKRGHLSAVSDVTQAKSWKVAFICVATPSGSGGQLDTGALRAVLNQIGRQISSRDDYSVIAIRSTTQPHILNEIVIPTLTQACGSAPGEKYGLVVTPEFLREGSAVSDFLKPAFTLIGESDSRAGDVIADLFKFLDAPVLRMSLGEAVMVKYASNAYHALKVAFANEIGLICARDGMDGTTVMKAFCRDTKLNIAASYLMPGFPFGGSCLPKDLRALGHRAKQLNIETPLLNAILPSNRTYLEECIRSVLDTNLPRIGIFGMSFKPGTDDMRESPMIALIETLIGKGKVVTIYDSNVSLAHLLGANREFIEAVIPHIASLMKSSIEEVVDGSDLLIVGNSSTEFDRIPALKRPEQILLDFSKPTDVLRGNRIGLDTYSLRANAN